MCSRETQGEEGFQAGRGRWHSRQLRNEEQLNYTSDRLNERAQKHIGIIGAGASGLVCAKECLEEGHKVTVFEQSHASGGCWRLHSVPETLDDLSKAGRKLSAAVHSSMYETVRVVIPREIMGHTEFPFNYEFSGSEDKRSYCGPHEVRRYLDAFKEHCNLEPVIEYETKVVRVMPPASLEGKWVLDLMHSNSYPSVRQFDAVVVANGHNTKPYIPIIKNLENFGRPCLHSHLYRTTEPFEGKAVVIIGNSFSGRDLTRDLSTVAKAVYVCGKKYDRVHHTYEGRRNVHPSSPIVSCEGEGKLLLKDKTILQGIDVIIFCTGYVYDFPFLERSNLISTDGKVVYPLYKQIFHTEYPTLAFLTLQTYVIPFLLAEFQSKAIARVLSGRCELPDSRSMRQAVDHSIQTLRSNNEPLENYHNMKHYHYDYMAELASFCGDVNPPEEWRKEMHAAAIKARMGEHEKQVDRAHPQYIQQEDCNEEPRYMPWKRMETQG